MTARTRSPKNPVIAPFIATTESDAKCQFEARAAWLETNKPELVDPSSRYYSALARYPLRRISQRKQLRALTREEWQLQQLTWDYLNQNWNFQPSPNATWRNYAVEAARHHALEGLNHLHALAVEEDADATEGFAAIILSMVKQLNQLALSESHRQRLIPFSRKCLVWPALKARRKVFSEDHDDLLSKLQVGKDTIFGKDSHSRFNPTRRFGNVTMELIERIECIRKSARFYPFAPPPAWAEKARALPPFCRSSKLKWWSVAEQILEEDFADQMKKEAYNKLVTAPSHRQRKKSVFVNKIREEFDTLADIHRIRK